MPVIADAGLGHSGGIIGQAISERGKYDYTGHVCPERP